jgi:transcriptional regulator with XRE-family HTH domain
MPFPLRELTPEKSPRHALGAQLRLWRTKHGWSQSDLAQRVAVSASLIGRVEKAERTAPADLLARCDLVMGTGGALSNGAVDCGNVDSPAPRDHGEVILTYRAGDAAVDVVTSDLGLVAFLDVHYQRVGRRAVDGWRIETRLSKPLADMALDSSGVGLGVDMSRRVLRVRTQSRPKLCAAVREAICRVQVAEWEHLEPCLLRASAIQRGSLIVLIVGRRGTGKTTLALDAVLRHGFSLLADEYLVLHRAGTGLAIAGLPTAIPVHDGAGRRLGHLLPAPFDTVYLGRDEVKTCAPATVGWWSPTRMQVGRGMRVVVLDVSYARPGAEIIPPTPMQAPYQTFVSYQEPDWTVDGKAKRAPGSDTNTIEMLVRGARMLAWIHRGEIAPALNDIMATAS